MTSSDGWNETPPNCIQFFAPNFSTPRSRFAARSKMPPAAAKYRIFFARSKSRRLQLTAKYAKIPHTTAMSSLRMESGAEVETTQRPIVVRKNATVSTSKLLRFASRKSAKSPHSTAINARKPGRIASASSGRWTHSCAQASIWKSVRSSSVSHGRTAARRVLASAWMRSCSCVMGTSVNSTPPNDSTSPKRTTDKLCCFPFTKTPPVEPASMIVQLPSS